MLSLTPQFASQAAPLRILSLGDSYTIGECVGAQERWPVQLAGRLRERGLAVAPPLIVARTGWTTEELSREMDRVDLPVDFDLVTLLIGVNDQYRGYPLAGYRESFTRLLSRAAAHAGGQPGQVLVLSIPDWGITPFATASGRQGISTEIDAFNEASRSIALRAGAIYIDVTPVSRQASTNPALLAEDGLHPAGDMYAAWVDLIFQQVA
jgi:lysophospholipase L1-like esterase